MKWLFNVFMLALVLLLNAGCGGPTPYQKTDDHSGLGYSDYQVQDNIYHVFVSGVPVKDKGVYLEYWNRRAKELCEGMGFQEYRIKSTSIDEGDPTPRQSSTVPFDRQDRRYRDPEVLTTYSRSASVFGDVECLKKSK